jgi:AmmeMemoRadiSam system protein B
MESEEMGSKVEKNADIREAFHAGTWYTATKEGLNADVNDMLDKAAITIPESVGLLRAIITPHAGLKWSGPTAAWSYKNIDPSKYKRVFLLGPSHKFYMPACGLTKCSQWATPLGNIKIDKETTKVLSE